MMHIKVTGFVREMTMKAANRMCPGMRFKADVVIANDWSEK